MLKTLFYAIDELNFATDKYNSFYTILPDFTYKRLCNEAYFEFSHAMESLMVFAAFRGKGSWILLDCTAKAATIQFF